MPRQYIITPELFDSTPHGFSQSVKVSGGATVYLSGQVGWDEHEALAGGRDFASQTRGAFENLQMAVQAAGGELRDVVSLRNYVINYRREEGGAISACLRDLFPPDALTATTWIAVQALARPELLIEIEAGAVLESRRIRGQTIVRPLFVPLRLRGYLYSTTISRSSRGAPSSDRS